MLFSEFNINQNLLRGITEAGYEVCTPVQQETFTHALSGKDVSVQSQTGTGKTAAFLVSLFQMMMSDKDGSPDKALIIAPTRELACQIEEEARLLGLFLPFTAGSFYGGTGYGRQEQLLRDGVDIIIATPGRLLDFVQQGKINLNAVGYLIIDEADRLFDMGFLPDLRRILRRMRPAAQRQTMLFSATLSYDVRRLASEHMNEPIEIEITPKKMTVDKVEQELYHVGQNEKVNLLLGLLQREAPSNCLLFVNMKTTAEELSERLTINGYPCEYLTGDLPQSRRQRTIDKFKSGDIKFLIATDVAARGLHIDELALVVNFDLPEDSENYVHRIGRTARAGKSGKAISIACEQYVESLSGIEKLIGMRIPVVHAGDELYLEDKSKGHHFSRNRGESRNSNRNRTDRGRAHPSRGNYHDKREQQQRQRNSRSEQSRSNSGQSKSREGSFENKRPQREKQRSGSNQPRNQVRESIRAKPQERKPVQQAPVQQKKKSLFGKILSLFK